MTRNLFIALLLRSTAAFTIAQGTKKPSECLVDYSAVNEFVKAHYGTESYLPSNRQKEAILDARNGILNANGVLRDSSIHQNGFQLVHVSSHVADWTHLDQVSCKYLPELKQIVFELNSVDSIAAVVFWHPMLRGEGIQLAEATANDSVSSDKCIHLAPVASLVHIDTDVQAYAVDDLVNLIFKNRISNFRDAGADEAIFRCALENRKRFAVWNFWRNIGTEPVRRAPLGIYLPCYPDNQKPTAFPTARPDPKHSRWYYYSDMTPNECLVFKQYDRRLDCISDLWHCALPLASSSADEKRLSFDLRALIVYDEQIPVALDRYKPSQSLLTLEESERFCRAQGEQRRQQQ